MPMDFIYLFIFRIFIYLFFLKVLDDADADGCAGIWFLTSSQTVGGVLSLALLPYLSLSPSLPLPRTPSRPPARPPARLPQGADHRRRCTLCLTLCLSLRLSRRLTLCLTLCLA